MTMVEDHSDDEVESISTPTKSSPHKDTPTKREDGPSNALLSPADGIPASYKGTSSIRNFSSPGGSRLNHGSRDLLNSPSSSFSLKSSSELTLGGGSQTTKDGLLASLVASRTAGKSDLFNVKDSDEPVAKKARKVDGINKSSDNSLGYTFSKYVGSGSGFTILPVNSSTLTAGSGSSSSSSAGGSSRSGSSSTTASGSHSSSASITADPLSGSSVKLANLPGVSLTSVSRANMASSSSSGGRSSSGGGGGLMPPPSSVTLSPVPRQTNPSLVNSPNERLSESDSSLGGGGKSTGSPSSNSSSNKLSASDSSTKLSLLSSKDTNNKQTFLINPITGQFEMGPPEPDPDAAAAAAAAASGDALATKSTAATVSVVGSEPSKIKVEAGQTSPGGEHSLKLKLKVSGPKVKESSSSSSSSSNTSSSSSQQPQSGGKLPKLKIKLKEKSVELEQSSPPPSLHNNEDSLESTKTSALPPHHPQPPSASSLEDVNSSSSSSSSTKSPQDESTSSAASSANASSPPPQQQLEAVTAAASAGHVQIDLKTRVRIKPLPEKMRILENSKSSADGHHFVGKLNNSQINHISVDTTPDKQRSKKSNMKEKKGDKNRLKIWTDSLAKHTKREDSGSKETKRWPEVLENRLFVQGSGQHSNQSNKLENNKNLEQGKLFNVFIHLISEKIIF